MKTNLSTTAIAAIVAGAAFLAGLGIGTFAPKDAPEECITAISSSEQVIEAASDALLMMGSGDSTYFDSKLEVIQTNMATFQASSAECRGEQ